MQNHLQVFENQEFGKLEVLMIDEKPYFPATECAKVLGYSNPHKAIGDHCRYLTKRYLPHPQSPTKQIEVNFIPEGDLYRLIIRSKLPAAVRFEVWLCDCVIPSIRRHGAYITEATLRRMEQDSTYIDVLIKTLTTETAKKDALLEYVSQIAPKARYCETILQCPNAMPVSIISKEYGLSATAFNKLLHGLGVQYKINGCWLLYSRFAGKGYTVTNTYEYGGRAFVHMLWTQQSRLWLYEFLKWYGILPQAERMT